MTSPSSESQTSLPQETESDPCWLYTRLPMLKPMIAHFCDFPVIKRGKLWLLWTTGACLLTLLGIMVLSGIFMALAYTPSETGAFASVEAIIRRLPSGWFLHLLHQGGVFTLFLFLYLHIGRGLWSGSYKIPRELAWLSGWFLFCGFLAIAFAGYCLPWGNLSYWAATVTRSALNVVPLPPQGLGNWLFGSASFEGSGFPSPATVSLQRLFVFHFAGALGLLLCVGFHITCVHGLGMRRTNPKPGEVGCCHRSDNEKTETSPHSDKNQTASFQKTACRSQSRCGTANRRLPFYPYFVANDFVGIALSLLVLFSLASFFPHIVGETGNLLPADPFKTPDNIHPPWYLAPFFAMLRAVPSEEVGLFCATLSILGLACLPWLDKSPKTEMSDRSFILQICFFLFIAAFLGLCLAGLQPPTAPILWISRLCLGWWLLFFYAVLPFFAWQERAEKQKRTRTSEGLS